MRRGELAATASPAAAAPHALMHLTWQARTWSGATDRSGAALYGDRVVDPQPPERLPDALVFAADGVPKTPPPGIPLRALQLLLRYALDRQQLVGEMIGSSMGGASGCAWCALAHPELWEKNRDELRSR